VSIIRAGGRFDYQGICIDPEKSAAIEPVRSRAGSARDGRRAGHRLVLGPADRICRFPALYPSRGSRTGSARN